MDILIKRQNYKEALEFLYERSIESDWNIFIEAIRSNSDFLEYFKKFLTGLTCVFRLKTFLLRIFITKGDKLFQKIVYEIISYLNNSSSEFSSHFLIRNLLLIQTVKLVVLDDDNRDKLQEVIRNRVINEEWFIELLDSFQMWEELGMFYELREDYDKCLFYYKKTNVVSEDKLEELMMRVVNNSKEKKEQEIEKILEEN